MRPSVDDVKRAASLLFDVPVSAIDARNRNTDLVRVRQIAMTAAKLLTMKSLPEVGRRFGRDHATVLYAVRKIEQLVKTDERIANDLLTIAEMVGHSRENPQAAVGDYEIEPLLQRVSSILTSELLKQMQPTAEYRIVLEKRVDTPMVQELLEAAKELDTARFTASEKHAIERVIRAARKAREADKEPAKAA